MCLQELFDHDQERKPHIENDIEAYPLNESSVAYFKKYEILHRHSYEEYNRKISSDTTRNDNGRHSVDWMRSFRANKDHEGPSVYKDKGVEIYRLRGLSKTIIQKDFQKKRRPARIQVSYTSHFSTVLEASSLFSTFPYY